MTVALAWIATRSDGREDLYFASDSRTRGGRVLDVSPKILTLPRSDCAICFSGDTSASYPLMLQLANTIAAHQPARERNLDIAELKSHLLRVMTDTVQSVHDEVLPFGTDDATFIYGGYSWRTKNFRVWTIYYEKSKRSFAAREARSFHPRLAKATFIGDWAKSLRKAIISRLNGHSSRPAEFEPLQELAKLLRGTTNEMTIGGAPQVVRIGPHMNTRPLCVLWGPDRRPTLFGRYLFDYENCDYWIIDPDTGNISTPRKFGFRSLPKTAIE